MTRRILREALIFGTIGVVATGLHYGIYWCLLGVMRPGWAYTLGYGVSLVVNFLLNASLTFRAQATARRGCLHISLLSLFLWLGIPEKWAPLPVFAVAVPVNFLLVRLVFRSSKPRG